MAEMFSKDADLEGLLDLEPLEYLYVSDVIHKASIEVNEKGSEATAATAASKFWYEFVLRKWFYSQIFLYVKQFSALNVIN